MYKKIIDANNYIAAKDYSFEFNFSGSDYRSTQSVLLKDFNEQIKQEIRVELPLENKKIISLIEQFIWESLKNSYDACLDKFLNLGGGNYHVNVGWEYKNGHFKVLIIDNGFGAKSSDSITKRTRGQQFYLGGSGKGVYLIRFKMEDLKEEVDLDYEIEHELCPRGRGAEVKMAIKINS